MQEHPDAVLYRNTCFSSFSDLCKIFQNRVLDERLTVHDAELIYNGPETISHCHVLETETGPCSLEIAVDGVSGNLPLSTEDISMSKKQKNRPASPLDSGPSRKVQKTQTESRLNSLSEMADLVAELAKKDNKSDNSIEIAIDALQAIPNMDDELLLDACDLLEDERKAKTFLALDVSLRKKWLLRKLRP